MKKKKVREEDGMIKEESNETSSFDSARDKPYLKSKNMKESKSYYNPNEIEKKWQKKWVENKTFSPNLDKALSDSSCGSPFYNLMMFPYPSAEGMHVGNMYAFTGADVYGRFKRMSGCMVFEPIGLDGFGIHSENYALKIGAHPMDQAEKSEKNFYRQMHAIGNSYDWERTVETYKPDYYRWTQWIFIQLFKAGLAYRKKAEVNWCPSCKTVLSDEQVISSSAKDSGDKKRNQGDAEVKACERCGTEVVKKELEQWFLKITDYAERLLQNIERLDWTEKVKSAQRQWIGKSEGALIQFPLDGLDYKINVFTTRQDTIFGATFMVLAPEHPLVAELLNSELKTKNLEHGVDEKTLKSISEYVKNCHRQSGNRETRAPKKEEDPSAGLEKEKTGVFSGLFAINPATGKNIPVWISDYVLMEYGTGAIMAVPAHDSRDSEFAKKYDLSIQKVVQPGPSANTGSREYDSFVDELFNDITEKIKKDTGEEIIYEGKGTLINSAEFSGLTTEEAKIKIAAWLEEKKIGKKEAQFHLRDWLISRQRYWGAPIPMIFCKSCEKEGKSWFTSKEFQMSNDQYQMSNEQREKARSTNKEIRNKSKLENSNEVNDFGFRISDLEFNTMKGWFPVEESTLPVVLPRIEDYKPMGSGKSPLAHHAEFYKTTCPNCGKEAIRETDVSDTFLDSAWYFLRYLATDWDSVPFPSRKFESGIPFDTLRAGKNQESRKDSGLGHAEGFGQNDKDDKSSQNSRLPTQDSHAQRASWLPVTMYIGGAEHSVLHLLYARFITMALKDLGYLEFEEPFPRFYAHGLIIKEGAKMSKSKGNVVVPDEYISKYGADTLRLYLMFLGPFSGGGDFRDTGMEGMYRFIKRVWTLLTNTESREQRTENLSEGRLKFMHKTIKGVVKDLEDLHYNTAIAKLMEWYNFLMEVLRTEKSELRTDNPKLSFEEAEVFLKLIAPFAPHVAEELWQRMNQESHSAYSGQAGIKNQGKNKTNSTDHNSLFMIHDSIHHQSLPVYDEKYLQENIASIMIQVNGKKRGEIVIESAERDNEEMIKSQAQAIVSRYLEGQSIKKVIYVPLKIINFVANPKEG